MIKTVRPTKKGLHRRAFKNGVEIMVYDVKINLERVELNNPLPYSL